MSKDWVALRETIFQKEYDFVLLHLSNDPRQVLDLGANIGLSVRVWTEHFPDAQVVAVEPDPGNSEICRLNIAASGAQNRVEILDCGVAAEQGKRFLDRSGNPMEYCTSAAPTPTSIEVPVKTVEIILDETGRTSIDLMKCDIEGAESEIFRHCSSWIGRIRLLAVELHPPYEYDRLLSQLRDNGARPVTLERVGKKSGTELALIAFEDDARPHKRQPHRARE